LKVFISKQYTEKLKRELTFPCIIIEPNSNYERNLCSVHVFMDSDLEFSFETLIIHEKFHHIEEYFHRINSPESSQFQDFEYKNNKNIDYININSINGLFITQCPDEEIYRMIVKKFDKLISKKILLAIHDAGTTMTFKLPKRYLDLMKDSHVHNIFLKENGADYAYKFGAKFLLDNESDNIEASEVFIEFEYNSFNMNSGEDNLIKLDFIDDFPFLGNINLFIGENGSGKSQSLNNLSERLLNKNKIDNLIYNRLIVISNTIEDPYRNKLEHFPKSYRQMSSRYFYINLINNKQFNLRNGVHKMSIAIALQKIVIDQKEKYEKIKKIDILISTMLSFIEFDDIALVSDTGNYVTLSELYEDISIGINYYREAVLLKNGFPLKLSSGQLIYFRMISYILSNIEQNSVLLFDEPENFLHPSIETELLSVISTLLIKTNSVAVIATHSSFFAREISKKYITVFRNRKDSNPISKASIETFGNDLDSIANYVFDDINKTKLYEKRLKNLFPNKKILNNFIKDNPKVISSEIYMYLNNEMD
jgi:ABC-type cobalamin/Fe3+-siderophores transport system ATPase subunit